jgi:hypothetical protein
MAKHPENSTAADAPHLKILALRALRESQSQSHNY